MKRVVAACLVLMPIALTRPAAGQGREAESPESEEVHWNERWRRFHPAEYAVVPTVLAGSMVLRFTVKPDARPNWRDGIVFDDWALETFFVSDPDAREGIKWVGDVAFVSSFAWSGADPMIAGGLHDWDVANQMFWMNLEAYSIVASVLWVSQLIVRRERPRHAIHCDHPDTAPEEADCFEPNGNRSFIGGHVATTGAAAALTCMHHSYLPIFGGGFADAVPCATGVAMTGVVFAARTMNGGHYLSDNLLGLALGAGSALVPWALHYGTDTMPDASAGSALPHASLRSISVSPDPASSGLSLQLGGVF